MNIKKFSDVEFNVKDEVHSYDLKTNTGRTKKGYALSPDVAFLKLKHGDKVEYDIMKNDTGMAIAINVALLESSVEERV